MDKIIIAVYILTFGLAVGGWTFVILSLMRKENDMGALKLFKRKEKEESLRDYCLNKYGEEFIEKYDTLCSGGVIGSLSDTATFIMVVDLARAEWRRKHGIEV